MRLTSRAGWRVACQICHMAADGVTTNFAPGNGGGERDPRTIFTHRFPGASDVDLLSGRRVWTSVRRDGRAGGR